MSVQFHGYNLTEITQNGFGRRGSKDHLVTTPHCTVTHVTSAAVDRCCLFRKAKSGC